MDLQPVGFNAADATGPRDCPDDLTSGLRTVK